jgi:hypothetical protein
MLASASALRLHSGCSAQEHLVKNQPIASPRNSHAMSRYVGARASGISPYSTWVAYYGNRIQTVGYARWIRRLQTRPHIAIVA